VTSTQAILARKRSGKSYTASVQTEEFLRHKQQIATIDPTEAWWGLRSSAAGGDHADAPLEPHAGRMLATALVEHGFSAIFELLGREIAGSARHAQENSPEFLRQRIAGNRVPPDDAVELAQLQAEIGRLTRVELAGRQGTAMRSWAALRLPWLGW